MTNSFRRRTFLGLAISSVAANAARADEPASVPKSPTPKPAAHAAKKPRVLVTVSKETTYITEPLRPDGYPDYVAAINQRHHEGVTPENNAAVLFAKAMGPGGIKKDCRGEYFKMLGIPALPEKGPYFISSSEWIERANAKTKPPMATAEVEPNAGMDAPILKQHAQATQRPWSRKEFPVWADWLAANEKPMALLFKASQCCKRYDPIVVGKNGSLVDLINTTLFGCVSAYREVGRAFTARAMLRVYEEKTAEAWQDLLAGHRLARLMGQNDATLVEMLVSIAVDGIACGGDYALLQHAKLTAAEALKMRDDLLRLPPMPKATGTMELGERCFCLDVILSAVRQGPAGLQTLSMGVDVPPFSKGWVTLSTKLGLFSMLDWDIVLRVVNSWCSRFVDATHRPSRAEKKAAVEKATNELNRLAESRNEPISLGLSVLGAPRKAISEQLGINLAVSLAPSWSACWDAADRGTMQHELTALAFAIAAYRADHNAYPAQLADLTPQYVAKAPKDLFNDSDLHYRREGNGYLLYSVGINGKDDGGKGYVDAKENERCDDVAIRMPAAN
jgi:hypothetical protein